MIWERPYYQFTQETRFYQFNDLVSSSWYTVVTMSSVGYGWQIASTPVGRFFGIVAAFLGVYITGVVVGVQRQFLQLDSRGV